MSLTNFASIISRELSGFLAEKIGIQKQIKIAIEKLDLFYIICLVLDFIGLVAVFFLLIKVKVPEQPREVELVEFNEEELKALAEREDIVETDEMKLYDVPLN